ncbi:MAG TPA: type II toxin-antitoxin system VapC family toxin [Chthoniobacterales bacterium]|jgi:predicted nucleic acid-binding protein
MLLVDTNVVAYLLIEGPLTAAARELRRLDPDWRSEAFLPIEFTNVLASSIAARRMTLGLAHDLLSKVDTLFTGKLARIDHHSVLSIAARYRISAYDARFLALANHLNRRLITEDARLRVAAPKVTRSLVDALAELS